MGISAEKYLIMNGLASIGKCYLRVRNFNSTKAANMYVFHYEVEVLVNNKCITKEAFETPNVTTPITQNMWQIAYDHLKEYLTSKGITFTDNQVVTDKPLATPTLSDKPLATPTITDPVTNDATV